MKKFFTLTLCLLAGALTALAGADRTFVFVDADGNEIPDGAELTYTTVEEDAFGGSMISLPLSVKTTDPNAEVKVVGNITRLDNGELQVCFPLNCFNYRNTGSFDNGKGQLQGNPHPVRTEWLCEGTGECRVTLQLKTVRVILGTLTEDVDGPAVSVRFVNDPASVQGVQTGTDRVAARYDLQGRRQSQGVRGLGIVRTQSGRVYKVFTRTTSHLADGVGR